MSPKFAYVYLMKDESDRIRAAVPRHVSHWQGLGLRDYLGGPFSDRSGGLITFAADNADQAERVVSADPFVLEGLLESYQLKQWTPE